MPTAGTITVRQVLDLLDGTFAGLAEGVAQRRYAFWLGSGISRDRVDDLKSVIAQGSHLSTRQNCSRQPRLCVQGCVKRSIGPRPFVTD